MKTPPNIAFILIDDMGWRDLSCFGSDFYETPNIDRLASRGLLFTDAYASCPVCSPTRASIMTGKYPATVNITNYIPGNAWGKLMGVPYFHALPKHEHTVAHALRDGGYDTWHVGKWHLGPRGHWPEDFGFDVNIAGCDIGAPYAKGYFSPYGIPTLEDGPAGEYLTDRLTNEAIRLIRGRSDKPFFLHLCHYAVHTPVQAPADLVNKYREKARRLGLDQRDPFEEGEYFPGLHMKNLRMRRRRFQSDSEYAAMVENLDQNVGRLLHTLDAEGIADNTLVVFTSDNGGLSTSDGGQAFRWETSPTCNAPLSEGKGWIYDGGVRVPMMLCWPERVSPGRTAVPMTSPDFYPTFLEAAGLPLQPRQHVDGRSLMPLLRGDADWQRGPIFWHYPHYSNQGDTPACAVRDGRWKLLRHFEDDRIELFDLEEDVAEEHNLAAQQPVEVQRLSRLLSDWQASIEAKIPETNPDYEAMFAGEIPSPDGCGRFPRVPGDDR